MAKNLPLALGIGVADPKTHQESIELGFGQGIGAMMLDRVLRRDYHERVRQRMGPAIDRYLLLVHGFEQSQFAERPRHGGRRGLECFPRWHYSHLTKLH